MKCDLFSVQKGTIPILYEQKDTKLLANQSKGIHLYSDQFVSSAMIYVFYWERIS